MAEEEARDPARQPGDAEASAAGGAGQPGDQPGEQQPTGSNVEKDPEEWVTGEEPMTGAQASYLKTLSDQAGEPFDEGLSKAAASKRIDELQRKTGRGRA